MRGPNRIPSSAYRAKVRPPEIARAPTIRMKTTVNRATRVSRKAGKGNRSGFQRFAQLQSRVEEELIEAYRMKRRIRSRMRRLEDLVGRSTGPDARGCRRSGGRPGVVKGLSLCDDLLIERRHPVPQQVDVGLL